MNNCMLWARRYVTIYGIIMLCTFFMCLLFNPASDQRGDTGKPAGEEK